MCCYLFNCISYIVDVLQRLLQFAMGMVICLVISVALILAIGVGIAYGYNYSLVEYISIKEPHQTLYLKRNSKEDTDLPIIKQINDFYKSSMNKLLRINYDEKYHLDSAEKMDPTFQPGNLIYSKFRTTLRSHIRKKISQSNSDFPYSPTRTSTIFLEEDPDGISQVTEINPMKTTLDFLLQIFNQEAGHTNKAAQYQKPKRGDKQVTRLSNDYDENELIILQTFQPVDVFDGTPISALTRTRRRFRTSAWTFDTEW